MLCAILMATFNGEKYIIEQLQSIISQSFKDIKIYISDDGSSDNTVNVINEYISRNNLSNIKILEGPQLGYAFNFMSMIQDARIQADYFAFSDQDDIWDVDKLSNAVKRIKEFPQDQATLYCSRSKVIDKNGSFLRLSPAFSRPASFKNAILQSVAGGNTMVMNGVARNVMASIEIKNIVSHDWWTYIVISSIGGNVYYDETPHINYRQHESNIIGENRSLYSRCKRISKFLSGSYKEWMLINCVELQKNEKLLTLESKNTLNKLTSIRECPLISRLKNIFSLGVYRQDLVETLAIYLMILFKRM